MKKDNNISLSRRQILAGLGTIGVASSGPVLGTTAFYNDDEAVKGRYGAGRVDLLLDYRTTYMPGERYDLQGIPEDQRPPVVPGTDGTVYELESVPDFGEVLSADEWGRRTLALDACAAEQDEFASQLLNGETGIFVDLDDIKPFDRGETTFSLHLCGNPSFLDVCAVDIAYDEDVREGVSTPTEPESEHGDTDDVGELQDFMHVKFWYDPNCNNNQDAETETVPTCVHFALDNSDSMRNEFLAGGGPIQSKLNNTKENVLSFVDQLEDQLDAMDGDLSPTQVGVTLFNGDGMGNPETASIVPTADAQEVRDFIEYEYTGDKADAEGSVAAGIESAANCAEACCTGYNVVVVVTNGIENTVDAKAAADDALSREGVDEVVIILIQPDDFTSAEFMDYGGPVIDVSSARDMEVALDDVFQQVKAQETITAAEFSLYEGPLSGLLDILGDCVILPPATTEESTCTLGDATNTIGNCWMQGAHCFGLQWYFPCAVSGTPGRPGFTDLNVCGDEFDNMAEYLITQYGLAGPEDLDGLVNVTQTDMINFGLEFSAEQCRHNIEE
ncbi:hypothetical protein [Haloarchaeobius sp. DT45]|uniref:hypothetical protein n=1 Tax=Haloarchaeobius sp. DT45 TaxID=3446116 RepID=UPI003F6C8587